MTCERCWDQFLTCRASAISLLVPWGGDAKVTYLGAMRAPPVVHGTAVTAMFDESLAVPIGGAAAETELNYPVDNRPVAVEDAVPLAGAAAENELNYPVESRPVAEVDAAMFDGSLAVPLAGAAAETELNYPENYMPMVVVEPSAADDAAMFDVSLATPLDGAAAEFAGLKAEKVGAPLIDESWEVPGASCRPGTFLELVESLEVKGLRPPPPPGKSFDDWVAEQLLKLRYRTPQIAATWNWLLPPAEEGYEWVRVMPWAEYEKEREEEEREKEKEKKKAWERYLGQLCDGRGRRRRMEGKRKEGENGQDW